MSGMSAENAYTEDTFFDGRIKCLQHRDGYRFSLDAVLLANFMQPGPGDNILDLGCGCGVISLILAYRWPGVSITGLEVQPGLAALAEKNVLLNKWQDRIAIVRGDLRNIGKYFQAGSFDCLVCNPPYRKPGTGKINIGEEQAAARHEQLADLAGIIKATSWAVKKKGRALFIYPASRCASIIAAMKNARSL